jgi:hypothetical protein
LKRQNNEIKTFKTDCLNAVRKLGEIKNGKKIFGVVSRNHISNFMAAVSNAASIWEDGASQQTNDNSGFVGDCHVGTGNRGDYHNCVRHETAVQKPAPEHTWRKTILSVGMASANRINYHRRIAYSAFWDG